MPSAPRAQAAEVAKTTGDDAAAQRLVDERKRRNYADFWRPIPANEPYRVVLADVRAQGTRPPGRAAESL